MCQEDMDMSKEVADNGTEYKLGFNGFYYWHRDGATADKLKGSFMCPTDAMDALRRYNVSLQPLVSTEVGTLDSLVPAKHKIPSAIKKFLQGGYDD